MRINDQLTDAAILAMLGTRVERQRIEAGLTQAELAREAGISKRTIERIEAGSGCELVMLIRVLRVLRLTDGLNALLPELPPSPMTVLRLQGRARRRVAHPRRTSPPPSVPAATATPAVPAAAPLTSSPPSQSPAHRKPWTWGE